MNGSCYTYPLILLEVDFEDPENNAEVNPVATSLKFLDYALIYDDEFAKDCDTEPLHVVAEHNKAALSALEQELTHLSSCVDLKCHELRISNCFDDL